jgi:hypothetical protein
LHVHDHVRKVREEEAIDLSLFTDTQVPRESMAEKGIDRLILFSDRYLCLSANRDDSGCCRVMLSKRLAFQSSVSCTRLRSTAADAEMWPEIPGIMPGRNHLGLHNTSLDDIRTFRNFMTYFNTLYFTARAC